jgi:uncharacterized membrane protein
MLAYFVKWRITKVSLPPRSPSQFVLGILGVLIINLFPKIINKENKTLKASKKNIFHLMLAGTSLGMTSVFYYLTVKYIPVPLVLFY